MDTQRYFALVDCDPIGSNNITPSIKDTAGVRKAHTLKPKDSTASGARFAAACGMLPSKSI